MFLSIFEMKPISEISNVHNKLIFLLPLFIVVVYGFAILIKDKRETKHENIIGDRHERLYFKAHPEEVINHDEQLEKVWREQDEMVAENDRIRKLARESSVDKK